MQQHTRASVQAKPNLVTWNNTTQVRYRQEEGSLSGKGPGKGADWNGINKGKTAS